MKKLLIIFLLMAGWFGLRAQYVSTGKSRPDYGDSHFYNVMVRNLEAGLSITIDSNTRWMEHGTMVANQPANYCVFLEGAKTIGLYLATPRDSASYYRYSIFDNSGNAIVIDEKVNLATARRLSWIASFNLGKFNVDHSSLTIKFYNINNRSNVASVLIYNKPIKPAQLKLRALYVSNKKGETGMETKNQPDGFKFKLHDKFEVSGVLLAIKPTDITFIYQVYLKNLATGKITRIGNNWNYGYIAKFAYLIVDASWFQQPGKYEISIVPAVYNGFSIKKSFSHGVLNTHFTVLEPENPYKLRQLLVWLSLTAAIIILIAGAIIMLQKRRHAKRITQEKNQKLQAQMQLSAVRAQLNPHFVFNALAGIQNLMNQHNTDQANRYLSKFARLTRSVLDTRDFITMADELALLNDYLEMEKLRFGFAYHINTDPALDTANLEIPAMLLQPLVENAVKHGVSGLGADGLITLDLQKQNDNIVLSVTDNGTGFDGTQSTSGLGLKLTHDRIKLLIELHPTTPISMQITDPGIGTHIIITLNHWL